MTGTESPLSFWTFSQPPLCSLPLDLVLKPYSLLLSITRLCSHLKFVTCVCRSSPLCSVVRVAPSSVSPALRSTADFPETLTLLFPLYKTQEREK